MRAFSLVMAVASMVSVGPLGCGSTAQEVKAKEALTPKFTVSPGWWSPLFELGRASQWKVVTHTKTQDLDTDPEDPPVFTESTEVGLMTCAVASVDYLKDGVLKSTVHCGGHDGPHSEKTPGGVWFTDGKRLWQPGTAAGPEALSLTNPPAPSTREIGEGEDVEVVFSVEAGETEGTWCHSERFVMGDGGVYAVCFAEDRGPYLFTTLSGSAAQDITTTITPK